MFEGFEHSILFRFIHGIIPPHNQPYAQSQKNDQLKYGGQGLS
jgi:hypothetical protein